MVIVKSGQTFIVIKKSNPTFRKYLHCFSVPPAGKNMHISINRIIVRFSGYSLPAQQGG